MMAGPGPLAILGGAFDPVHYGHLRTAFELRTALSLAEIRFIPSANPPKREAHIASGEVRMRMLESSLENIPWAKADNSELLRDGPSWSVVTLSDLRKSIGERSLCMILGMDAFLGLPDWHRWEEICELAHLVVARRPGWEPPSDGLLGDLLNARRSTDVKSLHSKAAGHIYIHAVTQLDISSSAIREAIAGGVEPRYLVADGVCEIIQQTACYQCE
jgi:nicotinate-nucleotide adenylyltransferase